MIVLLLMIVRITSFGITSMSHPGLPEAHLRRPVRWCRSSFRPASLHEIVRSSARASKPRLALLQTLFSKTPVSVTPEDHLRKAPAVTPLWTTLECLPKTTLRGFRVTAQAIEQRVLSTCCEKASVCKRSAQLTSQGRLEFSCVLVVRDERDCSSTLCEQAFAR